ncbi:MAG: HopJ type III effector protein [Spongiibacter sp.]|nr:HopJ type III effector protein [Spongiibacter sp.]
MSHDTLIAKLNNGPVDFAEVIGHIDQYYDFSPTRFRNGELVNEAGSNNGSCKIFAFAQLHQLSPQATLNAFGDFYTVEVLQQPEADNHGNIRNFIRSGWAGVHFDGEALTPKTS